MSLAPAQDGLDWDPSRYFVQDSLRGQLCVGVGSITRERKRFG